MTEDILEEHFAVSGIITLVNHNPEDPMTVTLSGVLNDNTVATITACTGDGTTSSAGLLVLSLSGTTNCSYTAAPTDRTATINFATAVLNDLPFSASDPIEWSANVIRGSATQDDEQNPAFPLDIIEGGTWKYTEQYTCSTDKAAYDATTHKYTFPDSNTAKLTSGDFSDTSTASTAVNCY